MSKRILFSPVGGTDPISTGNFKDGSLLHICRVYRPDKVILYMSKEIIDFHNKDNRYCYCLDKLAELLDHHMEYEFVMRPDLTDVQDFDYYYNDFAVLIRAVFNQMEPGDELLLNTSSGTPAMKSGLLVLQTLGEYPCTAIQVVTPARKMQDHHHDKEYDVETIWDLDLDNTPDFENRCVEVKCLNLLKLKNEEIIKKHVLAYDYQAALTVAESMPGEYTKDYLSLLRFAFARESLDFKAIDAISSQVKEYQLPIRDRKWREYVEYALELDNKVRRKKYADFIRAISPIFVDLLMLILRSNTPVKLEQYCKNGNNGLVWDYGKLKGTDVERVLNRENGFFKGTYMQSIHMIQLIKEYSNNKKIISLIDKVRYVEDKVRNIAAHQIITINDDNIKNLTEDKLNNIQGYSAGQIMDMIKELFLYTDINTEGIWNSYDEMNQAIIDKI